MQRDAFDAVLNRLKEIGLLLGDDGEYRIKDWARHQYLYASYLPSIRKLKKEETLDERQNIVKSSSKLRQANIKTDTDTETDTDTDSETEKEEALVGHSHERVPYARIVECWNRVMMPKGLPEVREITDPRKAWMRREWRKQRERLKTVEDFEDFFQYLATKCTFLFSGTWFSFDWLFRSQTNFVKAFEGNYEDGRRPRR